MRCVTAFASKCLAGRYFHHKVRNASMASVILSAGAFPACFIPLRMAVATLYDSYNFCK